MGEGDGQEFQSQHLPAWAAGLPKQRGCPSSGGGEDDRTVQLRGGGGKRRLGRPLATMWEKTSWVEMPSCERAKSPVRKRNLAARSRSVLNVLNPNRCLLGGNSSSWTAGRRDGVDPPRASIQELESIPRVTLANPVMCHILSLSLLVLSAYLCSQVTLGSLTICIPSLIASLFPRQERLNMYSGFCLYSGMTWPTVVRR